MQKAFAGHTICDLTGRALIVSPEREDSVNELDEKQEQLCFRHATECCGCLAASGAGCQSL